MNRVVDFSIVAIFSDGHADLKIVRSTDLKRTTKMPILPIQIVELFPSLSCMKKILSLVLVLFSHSSLSAPSLFLPLGSYMSKTDLATVFYDESIDFLTDYNGMPSSPLGLKDARNCWSHGYDISVNSEELNLQRYWSCERSESKRRQPPINAAMFLYSMLVPYGSYLEKCIGVIATLEDNRKYLYATCDSFLSSLRSQKLDITDCENMDITSDGSGTLSCRSPRNLPPGVAPYLPPGNYILTCRNARYYPCGGRNKSGQLEVSCRTFSDARSNYSFEPSSFDGLDGDDHCQVGELGYISNIDGALTCDPDVSFQSATEMPNSMLMTYFECRDE